MMFLTMKTSNVPGKGRYSTIYSNFGVEICKTIEREYLENQKSISSVTPGEYELVWRYSPKFDRECLYLSAPGLGVTVEGPSLRTVIMFHSANKPSELNGCIAPVTTLDVFGGEWGGLGSKDALSKLERGVEAFERRAGVLPKLIIE